jgi:hypothetical protein
MQVKNFFANNHNELGLKRLMPSPSLGKINTMSKKKYNIKEKPPNWSKYYKQPKKKIKTKKLELEPQNKKSLQTDLDQVERDLQLIN